MTSTFINSDNIEQFAEDIQPGLDSGLNLADVEYADGLWIGVFNEGSNSAWNYHPDFVGLEAQIQERWEQGYELIDVEYGNGIWFASFEEGISSNSAYVSDPDPDAFSERIQEYGDQGAYRGYDLYDVEYGDGIWFAVLNDELGGSTYTSSPDTDTLAVDIDSIQAQDYDLVGVEYTGNGWVSVFHEPTGVVDSTYTIGYGTEEFNEQITEKLNLGYDLIDLEYGDGIWVGVFDGVIASTGSGNSSSSTSDVITDSVINNAILENYHTAFDPDYYFGG